MFLGLLDPNLLDRGTDPAPSSIRQNSKINLDSYCFMTFCLGKNVNVPSKSTKQKT
jgi:hypothetical protein